MAPRGGKRDEAGRKPLPEEEKKVQISGYVKKKYITKIEEKHGEKVSKIIEKLIIKDLESPEK